MTAVTFTTDNSQPTRGWDAGRGCRAGRPRSLRCALRQRIELEVSGSHVSLWEIGQPARHLQGFSFRESANSLWSVELGASNHA
jgi:hypothetical protein